MDARTEGSTGKKTRGARGRINTDQQEAVIRHDLLKEKIDHLVKLHKTASEASADLADGIKAVAEKSGLLASVVRKFVVAKAGENFQEKKKEVEQLALVFETEAA